jgi:hypothetical protein
MSGREGRRAIICVVSDHLTGFLKRPAWQRAVVAARHDGLRSRRAPGRPH